MSTFHDKPASETPLRQAWALVRKVTRHGLMLGLLCAAAGGMVARAAYLQLIHKDFLQEQGSERYLRTVEVSAHRGMIVDRNGEPLAVSSPVSMEKGRNVTISAPGR